VTDPSQKPNSLIDQNLPHETAEPVFLTKNDYSDKV